MNPLRTYSVTIASLGGLLFGFHTAVMAGVARALAGAFDLAPATIGLVVSSGIWGGLVGVALAFRYAARVGRRLPLLALAGAHALSAIGCALAWNWQAMTVFRLAGGIALGGLAVIGGVYAAEFSSGELRARLALRIYVNVTLGIALAYLTNCLVEQATAGPDAWRWKLGVAAALAYLLFFALFPVAESPCWLMRKGRSPEARETLVSIGEPDVDARLKDFAASNCDHLEPRRSVLLQGGNRPLVMRTIGISLFGQLTGMSVVFCYLHELLARAGFSERAAGLHAVLMGLTNLVVTLIVIRMMEQLDRKQLLLGGSFGVGASLVATATILHTGEFGNMLPYLLTMLVTFFAASQGVAVWAYVCDLLPHQLRVQGQCLALLAALSSSALLTGLYPVFTDRAGVPFGFFALMAAAQFLVVMLVCPDPVRAPGSEVPQGTPGSEPALQP